MLKIAKETGIEVAISPHRIFLDKKTPLERSISHFFFFLVMQLTQVYVVVLSQLWNLLLSPKLKNRQLHSEKEAKTKGNLTMGKLKRLHLKWSLLTKPQVTRCCVFLLQPNKRHARVQ